jgi:hypothetical protein
MPYIAHIDKVCYNKCNMAVVNGQVLEQAPVVPFSADKISQLILSTYRFSQGRPALQHDLINYLLNEHGDAIYGSNFEAGIELAEDRAIVIAQGMGHINKMQLLEEIETDFNSNVRVPLTPLPAEEAAGLETTEMLIPTMVSRILDRDGVYHSRGMRFFGSKNGAYFSHFLRYIVAGHPTGTDEFNALFKLLQTSIEDEPKSYAVEYMAALACKDLHLKHNPQDTPVIEAWGKRLAPQF